MGHGLIFRTIIVFIFSFTFNFTFLEAKHSKEFREKVNPYLMPRSHPVKPLLDQFFSSSRVILNLKTLKQAGFSKTRPRKFTKLIVTKHPAFPGYVFKLYLDAQRYHKDWPEHYFWILRIQGAEKIRHEIKARKLEAWFKVPHKWIYELPKHPQPPKGYYPKHYILVEEDMDLLSDKQNKIMWKSNQVTPTLLDHLFAILDKLGLHDCAKPDNIPFSKDGRIAFIDTQTFGSKKVSYYKLTPYLSKSNQNYWKTITK